MHSAAASHGQPLRWLDFSASAGGIAIIDHPANTRHPSPWYVHDRKPMSFFSPAVLLNQAMVLAPGQSLKLSYRVLVHSNPISAEEIEIASRSFSQH